MIQQRGGTGWIPYCLGGEGCSLSILSQSSRISLSHYSQVPFQGTKSREKPDKEVSAPSLRRCGEAAADTMLKGKVFRMIWADWLCSLAEHKPQMGHEAGCQNSMVCLSPWGTFNRKTIWELKKIWVTPEADRQVWLVPQPLTICDDLPELSVFQWEK